MSGRLHKALWDALYWEPRSSLLCDAEIDLDQTASASIATPAASSDAFYFDTSDGLPKFKDPTGAVRRFAVDLVYDVTNFGAKGDLKTVFDGAMTSGLATLTCATSAPFSASDVGKRITVARAGVSNAMLVTTIQSFTSSSVVVLAASAGSTVSSSGVSWGTDDTNAVQTAITTAQTAGGGIVWFPAKRYAVTSTITVTGNGTQLWGPSGAHTTDAGDYTKSGSAWLCWWAGAAPTTFTNGIVLQVSPVQGASNPALTGFGISGLSIDCRNGDQNGALIGFQILSAHGFYVRDFFVNDASAVAIDMNVVATLGEARDCTRWVMERICVRALDNPTGAVTSGVTTSSAVTLSTTPQSLTVTANSLPAAGFAWFATNLGYPVLVNYTGGGGTTTLTGCTVSAGEAVNAPATVSGGNVVQAVPGNSTCHRFDGDTTANTCCSQINTVQMSHGTTWGPAAFEFRNSDSIQVYNLVVNGGNATNDGAVNRIRKPGVRLNGSNTNATLAARNNQFSGGSAGVGGVSVMGVNNAGTRLTAMSQPHYWDAYQLGNAEPVPTIEGTAYLSWYPNGGYAQVGHGESPMVADQAIANTLTLVNGTLIAVPPQGFQVGTTYRWKFTGVQTAAAASAAVVTVRIGTAGTTADAAVLTATFPAATTATGTAFDLEVTLTVRTLGAAATVKGKAVLLQQTAAGIGGATSAAIPVATFATFNSTTAQQLVNVSFISGGATTTVTFETATAEIVDPGAP